MKNIFIPENEYVKKILSPDKSSYENIHSGIFFLETLALNVCAGGFILIFCTVLNSSVLDILIPTRGIHNISIYKHKFI